jgi:predicted dehydrogenase
MIKIGIVGAGFIGKIHANMCNKIKNASVVATVDKVERKAKDLANKFNTKFYSDIDMLLDNENVDVVAICTPTYLHAEMVKKVANAKKNIFCEKPLTLSMKKADEMVEIVKKNKIKAMVGQVLRFWPEYVKIKDIIESGNLGKPLHAFCERLCVVPDWTEDRWNIKEELSGGAALDLQIHDLDYLIYLFGKPSIVKSQGVYNPNLGGWAHMSTTTIFESGQCGLVNAGWIAKGEFPFTVSLRVFCENGVIEWIFRAGKNIEERMQQIPITIYKSDGSVYTEKVRQIDPYYLEWEYFIDCLENDKDISNATFEDARIALKLALASIESAKNMKVVRI